MSDGKSLVSVIDEKDIVVEDNPDSIIDGMVAQAEIDYEYARRTSINALEIATKAVVELKDIAYSSQDQKSYDALGRFLKVITDSSKILMELNEKRRQLGKPREGEKPPTINNNLVITSSDLLRQILAERKNGSGQ